MLKSTYKEFKIFNQVHVAIVLKLFKVLCAMC